MMLAPTDPRRIAILVLPKFSHLTLGAVVEPMRVANKVARRVLYEWELVGSKSGIIEGSNGIGVMIHADITRARPFNTLFVVSSFDVYEAISPAINHFVRSAARNCDLVGGFETGAYVLAAAGVLDGYRATSHWEDLDDFQERYRRVDVVSDRFVIDRNRFSTGGALPALDFMLELVRQDHGLALSITVSGVFIYDQDRSASEPQHAVSTAHLGSHDRKLAEAISYMETNIEMPLSVESIAKKVGIGARELQRRFSMRLGTTPLRFFNDMRLSIGYRLLEHTDRTVEEIAVSCGFESGSAFARAFRARFNRAPTSLRKAYKSSGRHILGNGS